MAASSASSLVGADSSYWVFVVKFFYGPELDDSWECVFSVPQVAWASVVRTAGVLLVIGLSGYFSLRLYRWWTNRQLNSRLDILQCHSPIHSIGSPLESLEYCHPGQCDALDLDNLFLSSGRGPTGSSKTASSAPSSSSSSSTRPSLLNTQILDKEGQMYFSPTMGPAARSSLHGSPQKANRRRERARYLAASGGASGTNSKRASPKHQQKYWKSTASPAGLQSSGYATASSFSSSGARPKSIYRRSSSRESDSYSADASDTNFSRVSRASSYSEYDGPFRCHGHKRYRQVRSSSRELLAYDEFDSCWSDVSSVDGESARERRSSHDSTGSQGLFLGSLDPQFEVRARHSTRPAMRFEDKHRQLCKWHQLPSCVSCGLDVGTSVSSGIGTQSSRRSLGGSLSRPRSSPDGATDNDELPELEMDDIFGTVDPSQIDVADLSERQMHYIEKLKKLCGASPTSLFNIDDSPQHGVQEFYQQQDLLGAVGGPKLGVDVKRVAENIENRMNRLRHSMSCDSGKSPPDWRGAAPTGMETPPMGMSKVNSCESFQSYASTDLSSLGCELDFELGGETEGYLDALESELHNLKQSCFDMDSNIVSLHLPQLVAAKKQAVPLLTAQEYQALAVELGLESDEDEQVAPYVSSPREHDPAFKGLRKPSNHGISSTSMESSANLSESGDVLMPLGGLGSPTTIRPQTPTPSIASSATGADQIGSRPQSHMSLEWDHTGLDEDVESNLRCLESPISLPFSDAGSDDLQSATRLMQKQENPLRWTVGIDSLTSSSAHSSLDPVESLGASGDYQKICSGNSPAGPSMVNYDQAGVPSRKRLNVLSPKMQRNTRILGRRDLQLRPQPNPSTENNQKLS